MDDWLRTPSICYFYIVCIAMISVGCFCGSGFSRLALLFGRILEKNSIYIYMYFYTRLMLALDFVIPISSTSLPGGNLVDGLPPAASLSFLARRMKTVAGQENSQPAVNRQPGFRPEDS